MTRRFLLLLAITLNCLVIFGDEVLRFKYGKVHVGDQEFHPKHLLHPKGPHFFIRDKMLKHHIMKISDKDTLLNMLDALEEAALKREEEIKANGTKRSHFECLDMSRISVDLICDGKCECKYCEDESLKTCVKRDNPGLEHLIKWEHRDSQETIDLLKELEKDEQMYTPDERAAFGFRMILSSKFCRKGAFPCLSGDRACSKRCDGVEECIDGLDEMFCKPCSEEKMGEIPCVFYYFDGFPLTYHCTPPTGFCDGSCDCSVYSIRLPWLAGGSLPVGSDSCIDESISHCFNGCNQQIAGVYNCPTGIRVCGKVCDGKEDCEDASDEAFCEKCRSSSLPCELTDTSNNTRVYGCVSERMFCDGHCDCQDRSGDVTEHFPTWTISTKQMCVEELRGEMCRNKRAVCPVDTVPCLLDPHIQCGRRCDGIKDCSNQVDEVGCFTCGSNHVKCEVTWEHVNFTYQCVHQTVACDGRCDCNLDWKILPEAYRYEYVTVESQCEDESPSLCLSAEGSCPAGMFSCGYGAPACIPKLYVCDSHPHCRNGKDEAREVCTALGSCHASHFLCQAGDPVCVVETSKCNGLCACTEHSNKIGLCLADQECSDCSDESSVACPHQCHSRNHDVFRCTKGGRACVHYTQLCDSIADCEDGSDEVGCYQVKPSCPGDFFYCGTPKDGLEHMFMCIPKKLVCNKEFDCQSKRDEFGCKSHKVEDIEAKIQQHFRQKLELKSGKCQPDDFKCSTTGTCIPQTALCNGWLDCLDGSDESRKTCSVSGCFNRHPDVFHCSSGKRLCVAVRHFPTNIHRPSPICDGVLDCTDGSDEMHCSQCIKHECVNGATCVPLPPTGVDDDKSPKYVCVCPHRYGGQRCEIAPIYYTADKKPVEKGDYQYAHAALPRPTDHHRDILK